MDVMQLVQSVGVPMTILIFVGFALWKVAGWVREDIVKPVVTKHMTFMDNLENTLHTQTEIQKLQAENCARQVELLNALKAEVVALTKKGTL